MRPLRSLLILALPVVGLGALFVHTQGCYNPEFGSPGFYCHVDDDPACPDGQSCINGRCIGGSGGNNDMSSGIVPKTGTYSGPTLDPGLTDESKCTDAQLEPNDSISSAIPITDSLMLVVDGNTPKLQMLAICPTGDNPKANGHDVDYYQVIASQAVSALVEITYDIKYGDLDVGIFRPDGSLVASDGSAVSNGCVAASLPAGTYYIGVGGANNTASNRYDLRVRFYSTPKTCGMTTPVDMAM